MKSTLLTTLLASTLPFCLAEFVTAKAGLQVDVYHLPPAPVVYQNSTTLSFSPTAFTLIHGQHDAVLVDASATISQADGLIEWIEATIGPKKILKAIYITHGHGDHFFTAPRIAAHWAGAQVVAKPDVNAHILQQYDEPLFTSLWLSLFPGGQIASTPFNASSLPADGTFKLEGHQLRSVEVGQADTYNSTVLYVPALDLVVGGDVVYGKCHQLFAEDYTPALRDAWVASLDRVLALKPKVVVPSHTKPGDGFGVGHVLETKRYIRVWESVTGRSTSWQELEEGMKKAFPERDGSFILRWSSQAPFNASSIEA